nr:hypothetical protein [uncultured Pseudomonas sp.]
MSKAQRYDHGRIGMIPTDCGYWYQASDYAKLEAENKALREQYEKALDSSAAMGAALAGALEEAEEARRDAERHELRANQYSEELTALRARVVVVPGRITHTGVPYAPGWNACLNELARLNSKAVSEGLLRRTLEFIKATNYQGSIPLGLIAELSELLGEGKEVGDVLVRE